MSYLSDFPTTPAAADIPTVMPSPFADMPCAIAKQAALLLQQRLTNGTDWPRDFFAADGGKMFGVLVVRDRQGHVGYLSAFSGMMNGEWRLPGFVPPIFEQAEIDSFLPAGKAQLSELAAQIEAQEKAAAETPLQQQIAQLQQQQQQSIATLKQRHRGAKALRKQQRAELEARNDAGQLQAGMAALALASQHHKREATNLALEWQAKLQPLQQQLDHFQQQLSELKEQRATLSRTLHQRVFSAYRLSNQLQQQRTITEFFSDSTPPAGAGDCAGAKLIHYANQQQLQPLAMAEFWWGSSPAAGVRHHQHFYPACRGKCRPILPFMLLGREVEREPCYGQHIPENEPKIIYQDDAIIIINKPPGLMSEPGKEVKDSAYMRLLQRFPESPELRLVHRLDMSTSGLILVAKTAKAYRNLQKQFIQRSVEKRYEALLSKRLPLEPPQGEIELPLRVDFDDRPRQLVCYEYGKPAKTYWQLIGHEGQTSRVYFYPHTGRTHQLRVHASHRDGLDAAIVGDELYGQVGGRLMLHAQRLCFNHPESREWLEFEIPAPF